MTICILPTLRVYVACDCHNKQRLFPRAAFIDWSF